MLSLFLAFSRFLSRICGSRAWARGDFLNRFLVNYLALSAVIFGGGTACVSPAPDAPEAWAGLALPSAFGGGGSSTNIPAGAGWLTDFNDATLNALVREAMTNNPDLRVTAARLQTAQANLRIAGADLRPSLTAEAAGNELHALATTLTTDDTDYSAAYALACEQKPELLTAYEAGDGRDI